MSIFAVQFKEEEAERSTFSLSLLFSFNSSFYGRSQKNKTMRQLTVFMFVCRCVLHGPSMCSIITSLSLVNSKK